MSNTNQRAADLSAALAENRDMRRIIELAGDMCTCFAVIAAQSIVGNERQATAPVGVEEVSAELALARSLRLEWPSIRTALNPDVHTPARTVAYLKARSWEKDYDRRGGECWHDQPDRDGKMRFVFVPLDPSFADWDKRMAELVHDLADACGTGELGVLADIAEAGDA